MKDFSPLLCRDLDLAIPFPRPRLSSNIQAVVWTIT